MHRQSASQAVWTVHSLTLWLTCCYCCCCCCCYHICGPRAQWPVSFFVLDGHPDSATDTGRIAHNSALTCRASAPDCRPWSSSAFFLSPSLSGKKKTTPQLGGRCFVSTPRRWGPNQRQMPSPCHSVLLSHSTHSWCEHTNGVGVRAGSLSVWRCWSCVTARGTATGRCLHVWPERDPARADLHHHPTMSSPPPAAKPVMANSCNLTLVAELPGLKWRSTSGGDGEGAGYRE